jgi:hypothetical protein
MQRYLKEQAVTGGLRRANLLLLKEIVPPDRALLVGAIRCAA